VQEERRFETIQERLNELVHACDAAIALPGGPGTLTEIALTWNLMIVRTMPQKPLILSGPGWRKLIETFYNSFEVYIPKNQRDLLQFAPDIISTVALLNS
jgi:predicted Rossmann-fold nucleotide-binding protein